MYARTPAIGALLLMQDACGDNPDAGDKTDPPGAQVWKSRTDMLDTARAIEDTVMEQSVRQRQMRDAQSR